MAFCSKCGEQIGDNAKSCPKCGAPTSAASQNNGENGQKSATEKINAAWTKCNDTADSTAQYNRNDIENNKFMSVLAYISILVLIPLFAAKDSEFARFHTNQGLVLFIVEVIIGILAFVPIIKYFIWILNIVTFVLAIIGIVNVCNGKAKELPLIGGIRFLSK